MKIEVKKISSLTGHIGAVYALAQGLSQSTVFSGSSDKLVALWDLETMQAEKFAAQFSAIVYAICSVPEKNMLIVGTSAGSVHVIDLENKKEIKILQHHTEAIFDIQHCP